MWILWVVLLYLARDCFHVCHWTKTGDELRRLSTAVAGSWLSRTCDGRRRLSQLVAGSMYSGKLNWIELNWTTQLSSVEFVEFSFPFRCALGFRLPSYYRSVIHNFTFLKTGSRLMRLKPRPSPRSIWASTDTREEQHKLLLWISRFSSLWCKSS